MSRDTQHAPASLDRMTEAALASYEPTDAAIAAMRDEYMPLRVDGLDDRDGLQRVHEARMDVKRHRVAVEKTRKALKADSLEYGRRVDSEAKRITALLEPIEAHLQAEEDRVAQEKERIKREAEERRRAVVRQRLEQLAAVDGPTDPYAVAEWTDEEFAERLADATTAHAERQRREAEERERLEREEAERRRKAEAEAEAARAERERLAEERAKIEAEREAVAAERRRIEEERAAVQRAEELRAAEAAAAERALAEREEAQARAAEAERLRKQAEAEEAARREAARPEVEKLRTFATTLRHLEIPVVSNHAALREILADAADSVHALASSVEAGEVPA